MLRRVTAASRIVVPGRSSGRYNGILPRAVSAAAAGPGGGGTPPSSKPPPSGGLPRPSFNASPGPMSHQKPAAPSSPQQQQPQSKQVIFNVGGADFKQIVLDSPVPVILDCWAEWCGPCRQLGPILEAAVKAQNGKVRMAKLDTDKHPQVAQQLGVKSLPTVMLVNEGKLVDQFVGFNGEAKTKEFVLKAAGLSRGNAGQAQDPNDILAMQGMLANVIELLKVAAAPQAPGELPHQISKEEMQEMIGALRTLAAHKLEPLPSGTSKTPKRRADEDAMEMVRGIAHAGLIRCALLDSNAEAAQEISKVTKNTFSKPVLEHPEVKSALSLASLASGSPASASDDVRNKLEEKIKANPKDSESRLLLAKALFADGAHGQAIEQALELLKRDRAYQDGAAKTLLIDIFNALGSNDLVKEARRKMSSILMN